LAQAALESRADEPVSTFSRGMRQRVALERALIHAPRLVLLDEPFTGLDDASASALLARLRVLRQTGSIVVAATHDLDLADGLFDRALFLRDGRIVDDLAAPRGLRAAYAERLSR
jgi:ABC-type multidrug transport system ATPase subunit